MARKRKQRKGSSGPAWLITFTDMMTLMLTFFVLLVSMSTLDERRRLIVLGSLIGTFGMGQQGYDPRTTQDRRTTIEPGPMEDVEDLEPLKNMLWEDLEEDLNFASNKFVEVLSISDEVLFKPGQTELSVRGKEIVDRMLPILFQIGHPLLLAGHTSTMREELGERYQVDFTEEDLDASWRMSFYRVLALYRYLLERGMDPELLRVEAYGKHRPRFSDQSPQGRSRNRRVDIVLDKRNREWMQRLDRAGARGDEPGDDRFIYKDFIFDVGEDEAGGER
jgi:chemotaxis protein MotB